MRSFHLELKQWLSDCDCQLHYVNAYEMANIVHQAEAGYPQPNRAAAREAHPSVSGMCN